MPIGAHAGGDDNGDVDDAPTLATALESQGMQPDIGVPDRHPRGELRKAVTISSRLWANSETWDLERGWAIPSV